jgi:hypothetical protein
MTHTIAGHLIGWMSGRIRKLVAPTRVAEVTTSKRFDDFAQADAPEVLVRAIRRLQYHQAFLARATIEPLPELVRGCLEDCLAQVFAETATFLCAAIAGLRNDMVRPALGSFTRSIATYSAALSRLRLEGVIDQLAQEEALRVGALSSGLDELRQDLESIAKHTEDIKP